MADKSIFLSKTFWAAILTAGLPFVPGVGPFVSANPQAVGIGLGIVFAALRAVTAGRVTLG